ncbi:MAG TPA: hypothetical protein VN720_07720 [Rudaea sp.]|nr:hypothetical protein [Rudaea sp.]
MAPVFSAAFAAFIGGRCSSFPAAPDECLAAGSTLRAASPVAFLAAVRPDGARVAAAAVVTRRLFAAVVARGGDFRAGRLGLALVFFAFGRFVMRGICVLRLQ